MRTIQADVKLKSQVVEVIDVTQFDSTAEAIATLGEEKCFGLINRQYKADRTNAARGKHREATPGKTKRFNTGINCLASVTFDDGETGIEKLAKLSVQYKTADERNKALAELINSPEVQAAVDEVLGVAAGE